MGSFFKKKKKEGPKACVFCAKIRALGGGEVGQNSNFLRSTTPLRVQRIIELSETAQ